MHSLYKDTENTEISLVHGHRWEKWEISVFLSSFISAEGQDKYAVLRRGNESGDDHYDG